MAPRAAAPKAAATKAAASKATKPRNETKFKKKPASAAKPKPIDFKSQASTDYPYHAWNSQGRTLMDQLQRKRKCDISAYENFLLQKWFPEQRKKFSKEEQRNRRADKIGTAAANEIRKEDLAESRAEKRKQQRKSERARLGLASSSSQTREDEVYERRAATVRVVSSYLNFKIVVV